MSTPSAAFVSGGDFLGDEATLAALAEGVHEAGNPYFDHVLGGSEAARRTLRSWVTRRTSEVFAGRARLLLEGGRLAGGYISLTGRECKACRMADTAALFARDRGASREALLARLDSVRGLLAHLEDDDWYLSKLWVSPALRGRGYALLIAEQAMAPGPGASGRVVVDVRADNEGALRTYARLGAAVVRESVSRDGLRYAVLCREGR